MNRINSKSDKDRVRERTTNRRRVDRRVADVARRIVAEHLKGRPADACMADLVEASRK